MRILARWTAHPAKHRPKDLALVVCVVALAAWAVLVSFQSVAWALFSVVVLLIAVGPFLLPTTYTVTEEALVSERASTRRSRRFAELRRVDVGPHVALLSPFRERSFLDRYRGMLVLFDGADRDRIVQLLREKVNDARAH